MQCRLRHPTISADKRLELSVDASTPDARHTDATAMSPAAAAVTLTIVTPVDVVSHGAIRELPHGQQIGGQLRWDGASGFAGSGGIGGVPWPQASPPVR